MILIFKLLINTYISPFNKLQIELLQNNIILTQSLINNNL